MPNYFEAYYHRGCINFEISKYEDAIDDFSKIIESEPNNFKLYLKRSECYKILGKTQEFYADIDKAKSLGYSL